MELDKKMGKGNGGAATVRKEKPPMNPLQIRRRAGKNGGNYATRKGKKKTERTNGPFSKEHSKNALGTC